MRTLLSSLALGSIVLLARSAAADDVEIVVAPPVLAPGPVAYGEPLPPPADAPVVRRKKGTGLIIGGSILAAFGTSAVIGGGLMVGGNADCPRGQGLAGAIGGIGCGISKGMTDVFGTFILVSGSAAIVASIPMIAVGAQRESERPSAPQASLVPQVAVGPTSGSLTWLF